MNLENRELNTAIAAAKAAGEILKDNFGRKRRVIRKSIKEMVSEVDMQSQQVILGILQQEYPVYALFTEEKLSSELNGKKAWIVDPLDGTHNYIAGLPFSGISIALTEGNDFYLGVIYFPMEGELYHAVKGDGAYCNGKRINVSQNCSLSKAIINFDNQFHSDKKSFDYYRILTERAFTTRIFGTATKDSCLIASARIDGRIWLNTKICDIAAGIVILREAGGKITNIDGTPCTIHSKKVVASNGKIHEELLAIFKGDL